MNDVSDTEQVTPPPPSSPVDPVLELGSVPGIESIAQAIPGIESIAVSHLAQAMVEQGVLESRIAVIDEEISRLRERRVQLVRSFDRTTGRIDGLAAHTLPHGMTPREAYDEDCLGLKELVDAGIREHNKTEQQRIEQEASG